VSLSDHLRRQLEELEQAGRLRLPSDGAVRSSRRDWVDVSSNDYLGYAAEGVSRETLDTLTGLAGGAGASRLIHGSLPAHNRAEVALASWVGLDTALLFSSGYAANMGSLSALAGPGDLIVSDALNHASLIDGCRLSDARVVITPHNDLSAIARALREPARQRWVVVEAYYSMDADGPGLADLRGICDEQDAALFVDEAHSLGVFGPEGAGRCRANGVVPDVLVGTLGKALGLQGAFVAGSGLLTTALWNRARSFVFSTGVSPLLATLVELRVERARRDDRRRAHLSRLCERLESRLEGAGRARLASRAGPIFPIVLGESEAALGAAAGLRARGFLAQAIRPPTVPAGTSRLRITLHASLSEAQVDRLADALESLCFESSS
jgi:8-amino-7-oxononanoate synthase